MTLERLAGRFVGPVEWPVRAEVVAEFVAATGDDPERWEEFAPPGFAAAALFRVAPAFLGWPEVAPLCRSLLHIEQAFAWARPLAAGEALSVEGRVAGVRSREERHLVVFAVSASGPAGPWLEGTSTFMLSAEPAAAGPEEAEPPEDRRAPSDAARASALPSPGEALPPLRRSASRADLVRYGAATGDTNPIHSDHAAAREAGLGGVVAHGLLLASWLFQAAARHRPGPDPLRRARVRFRRPLRPGLAAVVTGRVAARRPEGADLELALEAVAGDVPLATAAVRVTP